MIILRYNTCRIHCNSLKEFIFMASLKILRSLKQLSRVTRCTSSNNNYASYSSSSKGEYFDIIIVGGGMVGTSLACKLGTIERLSDKSILLLEGSPRKEWVVGECYSNRVSAINPQTKALIESLGAWKYIEEHRFKAVKKMQVWDAISDAMITFNHDDMLNDVAYIIENDVILASFARELENIKNVCVIYESKLKNCVLPASSEKPELVSLKLEDGRELSCSLLVGADGANSLVRKAMGVQYLFWNYNQMGIVATLRLSEPSDNIVAWQRFLPTGPIALLPLNEELSSLVWTTTTEQTKELLGLTDEQFVDAVNDALWKQYPRHSIVDSISRSLNSFMVSLSLPSNAVRQLHPSICTIENESRAAFPLAFGHSTKYVAPSVALLGDAAHRVHPLAGQGVNLGFGDVECLADKISEAVAEGQNVDNLPQLLEYETLRQRHNVPTMLAIDGLQKLYGCSVTPVVLLRSVGLQIIHSLPPIKRAIMNHASV